MVNHFEVIAQIVDLFIVTPDYCLKYNSGVTEMLKNYTVDRCKMYSIVVKPDLQADKLAHPEKL